MEAQSAQGVYRRSSDFGQAFRATTDVGLSTAPLVTNIASCDLPPERSSAEAISQITLSGSEQEFDRTLTLSCFPENHEFGLGSGYALRLQQQVSEIRVAATAAQQ